VLVKYNVCICIKKLQAGPLKNQRDINAYIIYKGGTDISDNKRKISEQRIESTSNKTELDSFPLVIADLESCVNSRLLSFVP